MLKLKNISKSYLVNSEEHNILNNINISFRDSEFVSILGKSGSGKSTLLNIIGLLDSDYSGSIYLNGKSITKYQDYLSDKLLRSKIGFVFQDYNLLEDFTVYKNIEIAFLFKGLKYNKYSILKILKRCNILSLYDKKVSTLSGGEKQRVAIARMAVNNPDIILLDEPTGALDFGNSLLIMKFIKDVFNDKLIIMVTHDKKLAKDFSDRIIILNNGSVLYDSKPLKRNTKDKLLIKNKKMNIINNFMYSLSCLNRNKFRNLLLLLAMIISITTISFVMFLSSGFKEKISEYQKTAFNNYPLMLTKSDNIKTEKGKINKVNKIYDIYFDSNFLTYFYDFCKNNNIKYLKKYNTRFNTNKNNIEFSSFLDNGFLKKNYNLLKGEFPTKDNEVLLKLNNETVDSSIFNYFNIKDENVSYDFFIGKKLVIKESSTPLLIVGVVSPKSNLEFNSLLESNSNILYNKNLDNLISNKKEYAIYVYNDKEEVIDFTKDYKDIKYQDLSKSFEDYLTKLVLGIEKIMLMFSFISLFISLLLIVLLTYISGIEREKEIGIIKSLGARKKDIRRIFVNEMIIISLLAALISIILVLSSVPIVNNILHKLTSLSNVFNFSLEVILNIIIISVSSGLLGSLIPAIKNSNKDTIKCFK